MQWPKLRGVIRCTYRRLKTLTEPRLLRQDNFVGGEWVEAKSKQRLLVLNPATTQPIASVPCMNREDTVAACKAAADAWPAWKLTTAKHRSALLRRIVELMGTHANDLAKIMTAECGKPRKEALAEVAYAASFFEFYAEEAKRTYGDVVPSPMGGRRLINIKQPIGPTALITPWNFPSGMIARKLAPALAAGCTVVIKPAEDTPLSALAIVALAEEAGIPKGVVNLVTTSREQAAEVGRELCTSPLLRKLSFTGSTDVGKWLLRECASTVKKVSLELGGNAPFLVFDDADLEVAVKAAVVSKFRNAGQTCISINRMLVQEGIYDTFANALAEAVSALNVGHGDEHNTDIGPLINVKGFQKVQRHVDDMISKGGNVLTGGAPHPLGGTFFTPTVVKGAQPYMCVWSEETFGPVAPLFKFKTEDEALAMANDTRFGLAAYACTSNLGRAWRLAEGLESGLVGINETLISTEVAPFGGWKESGLGREGSKYGIDEYLELKHVCMGALGGPL